jgi:hypothetical protein
MPKTIAQLYAPGHFYSPVPDPAEAIQALHRAHSKRDQTPVGIEFDDAEMLAIWDQMKDAMTNAPFIDKPSTELRYYYLNNFYNYGDALIYHGLLSQFRPTRIVEIGSGFSSALALDTRDLLGLPTKFTFIEPYPNVLNKLLRPEDRATCEIIQQKVQHAPPAVFERLQAGDFLFIDSSHVAKSGSDVCYEVFEILPILRPGVIVHFHDIFWPLEYPKPWIEQGRGWNEIHFVRAFLMYNPVFKVLFFNAYFHYKHPERVAALNANCARSLGGGLWIKKVL